MKKHSFFSRINIELLPVLIPIILSLSSWTIYKVIQKDKNIVKPVNSSNKYPNPFKINCDFLKVVKSNESINRKSDDLSDNTLISKTNEIDSSALNLELRDKGTFNNLPNIGLPKKLLLSEAFKSKLINSGYIGEIGNLDPQKLDTNASDNIFNVQTVKD